MNTFRNTSAATAEQDHFADYSEIKTTDAIFAFSFERIILPIVRTLTPQDSLPLYWIRMGEEDSFKSHAQSKLHFRHCTYANQTGQPCTQCLEYLAGFTPVFDLRLVCIELASNLCDLLLACFKLLFAAIRALAFFSVAIWLVPATLTPKQKKELEQDKSRKEAAEKEHEHQTEHRNDGIIDTIKNDEAKYRNTIDRMNAQINDSTYADMSSVKEDDKLVNELNHLCKAAAEASTPEEREKVLREKTSAARALEKKREEEFSKHKKRSGAVARWNALKASYDFNMAARDKANASKNYEKAAEHHQAALELVPKLDEAYFEYNKNL